MASTNRDVCPRCDSSTELGVVSGTRIGVETSGQRVKAYYVCPLGHQWDRVFKRGAPDAPRVAPNEPRKLPTAIPPPNRCIAAGCHYTVYGVHAFCFVHEREADTIVDEQLNGGNGARR